MPRVSVILPSYNGEKWLARSIGSVLNQTFNDLELIVIDDGSTDHTPELVTRFADSDRRVKYIREENYGAPARPRNAGIKASSCEYIAFLDSDDEWVGDKLAKQLDLFSSLGSRCGIVSSNILLVDDQTGSVVGRHDISRYLVSGVEENLLEYNFLLTPSAVLARRALIEDVGLFDELLRFTEDWDIWIRACERFEISYVPEFLTKYHIHGGNVTKNLRISDDANELEKIFLKHKERFAMYPAVHERMSRRLGSKNCAMGQYEKGRGYYRDFLRAHPGNIKMRTLLLGSYVLTSGTYSYVYKFKSNRGKK